MRILVTGADGFIGRSVCSTLGARGIEYRRAFRSAPKQAPGGSAQLPVAVGCIGPTTDWADALAGVTTVVHLAARVHILRNGSESLQKFRRVNVAGTERLAHMSVRAGVRRLVYVSTVKVHGNVTRDSPFTEAAPMHPRDAYAISKMEAEHALREIEAQTGLEIVILRPPLVYGPGVKGNFFRLMRLVARGVPLPFAGIGNCRSLAYVDNLAGAIVECVEAPAAAGKTYLVSDEQDVSTADLVRALAGALRVPARLFSVPPRVLALGAALLGKREEMARLAESLKADSSKIRSELGWHPRITLSEGLEKTAQWYRSTTTAGR